MARADLDKPHDFFQKVKPQLDALVGVCTERKEFALGISLFAGTRPYELFLEQLKNYCIANDCRSECAQKFSPQGDACGDGGVVITVDEHASLGGEISLKKLLGQNHGSASKIFFMIGKGARLSLHDDAVGLASIVFVLCEGTLIRGSLRLASDCEVQVKLLGFGSEAEIELRYRSSGKRPVNIVTGQRHLAGGSRSLIITKGVTAKGGSVKFESMVYVNEAAEEVEAVQRHENLALSGSCKVLSKPCLVVANDDAICQHGSASSQISKSVLFYLQARGLSRETSENVVAEGFLSFGTGVCGN